MSLIGNISDTAKASGTMSDQLQGTQLSQEGFLKLLLAQLKMQSPTNPFDSSTMMQQISQLTGLSAAEELAKTVKGLGENMGTSQILDASRLVGQHVQIPSQIIPLTEEEGLKGAIVVPKGINSVDISIRDMNDKILKTLTLSPQSDGVMDFAWDGLDSANQKMAPGYYKITAEASLNGKNTSLAVAGNFKVNSVTQDRIGKGIILNVDGLGGVNMKDIIKIL